MATAFVQSKGGQLTSGATTMNINLTGVGAGNHLFAACGAWQASTYSLSATTSTPSATWSVAQASDVWNSSAGNFFGIRGDYSENVASGSWTVTMNASNAVFFSGFIVETSGAATSASLGNKPAAPTHAGSAGSAQPGSVTPTAGSMMIAWMVNSGTITSQDTVNSSYTATPAGGAGTCWDGNNQRSGGAYLANASGAAVNPTLTEASGAPLWNIMQVEFKAAAGGGGGGAAAVPSQRTLRGVGV